ncbi:UHRF1-binding protein 1-like protein [Fragariocoptes setiger]|uniref:UHRF1-binding protein 1-like protein n=1 Tax=Fragariocoptes setiger TaxID=1670756 RepID=A0ABQ7SAL0_9ACAR|nr:UHRF1-binding protein 1-like protein [Fragariocoptes setiger]
MASFVKAQILKHLTRFFKNLAPEQLQLSTFKGSCELYNLELEESVLVDLLSFPSWLTINKAACNSLTIKISWTKMKSVPIQMNLDEVTVEMEICEQFRDTNTANALADLIASQAPGKYGFSDRVIDGMTVTINNVLISFKSKVMSATFNLSRILLESRCPNWKQGELPLTRIKDSNRGQILLFKIAEWQTMRLEAKCLTEPNQAPLRLITNHAQCRITIKKKLEDRSVLAARIFVIFEDILWVLTFAQFISAASFVEYIFALIKRSPITKKSDVFDNETAPVSAAAVQHPTFGQVPTAHVDSASKQQPPAQLTGNNMSAASLLEQKFLYYDVRETSLHLFIEKIDAHLYDDMETSTLGLESVGTASKTSSRNNDSGGALQTTIDHIQMDCYPYSRATGSRQHWFKFFDPSPQSRRNWLQRHFAEFDLMQLNKKQHSHPLNDPLASSADTTSEKSSSSSGKSASDIHEPVPTAVNDELLSLTVLIRLKDYCMNCVATKATSRFANLNKFIMTDKSYQMPAEMPSIYFELDYFYYFPRTEANTRKMIYEDAPDPVAFVHVSPSKLLFDSPTLLFLNSFQANLSSALVRLNDLFPEDNNAPKIHCRIEILMPQLTLPASSKSAARQSGDAGDSANTDQPASNQSTLLVKCGKLTLSNSIYDSQTFDRLSSSIRQLIAHRNDPSYAWHDRKPSTSSQVWNSNMVEYAQTLGSQLWSIALDPIWLDFMDADAISISSKLQSIIEPVKVFAFAHLNIAPRRRSPTSSWPTSPDPTTLESQFYSQMQLNMTNDIITADHCTKGSAEDPRRDKDTVSLLVTIKDNPVLANIEQKQLLFLERLIVHFDKFVRHMKADALKIIKIEDLSNLFELDLTVLADSIKARVILNNSNAELIPTAVSSLPTVINKSAINSTSDADDDLDECEAADEAASLLLGDTTTDNHDVDNSTNTNRNVSHHWNESSLLPDTTMPYGKLNEMPQMDLVDEKLITFLEVFLDDTIVSINAIENNSSLAVECAGIEVRDRVQVTEHEYNRDMHQQKQRHQKDQAMDEVKKRNKISMRLDSDGSEQLVSLIVADVVMILIA